MSMNATQSKEFDESFKQYVRSELAKYDARIDDLEELVNVKDNRIKELEDRIQELEGRTDLLRLVENSDELEGEQRSAALLQHLHKKATNTSGPDKAAITRDRAEEVLHYPDIHRTTFISDMERCVRLVGDEGVCWYEGRDKGPSRDARLVLDLEGGELPNDLSTKLNGGA